MDPTEFDVWRDSNEYGALRFVATRPIEITIDPQKALRVGPMPVTGYTVLGDYFLAPAYFTADDDVPALPPRFHMMIVWKALLDYAGYEESNPVVLRAQRKLRVFERALAQNQLPSVGFAGALA